MTTTDQFLENGARFSTLVEGSGGWDAPSPCTDWTAGAVLDHVVDTQRDLMSQRGFPLGDRPLGGHAQVWQAHLGAMRATLADEAVPATAYGGFFGPTTVGETLATFYGFDLMVHGWDLGKSWDRPPSWTDAEMDQVKAAMAGFGDHLYLEGICREAIEVPDDAPRQHQILGLLGRRP
jgi:uncharacterized protein (TIGR03086 family)